MASYTSESRILHCSICGVSRMHTMIVEEIQKKPKNILANILGYFFVGGIFFLFYLLGSIFLALSCFFTKEPISEALKNHFKDLPKQISDIFKDNSNEECEQHRSFECKFCGTIHPEKEVMQITKKP